MKSYEEYTFKIKQSSNAFEWIDFNTIKFPNNRIMIKGETYKDDITVENFIDIFITKKKALDQFNKNKKINIRTTEPKYNSVMTKMEDVFNNFEKLYKKSIGIESLDAGIVRVFESDTPRPYIFTGYPILKICNFHKDNLLFQEETNVFKLKNKKYYKVLLESYLDDLITNDCTKYKRYKSYLTPSLLSKYAYLEKAKEFDLF